MTKPYRGAFDVAQKAIREGKNAKAIEILGDLGRNNPEDPNPWLMMALAASTQEEAEEALDQAVARKAYGPAVLQIREWVAEHLDSAPVETPPPFPKKISRMIAWQRVAPQVVPIIYLVFLTAAEAITTLVDPRWGMVMHGSALFAIYLHAAFSNNRERLFLLSLSLAPLIRLLSLTLPALPFPVTYWYAIVGGPLFVATFFMIRTNKLTNNQIGMTAKHLKIQLLIIPFGVILGYIEFLILRPEPLVDEFTFEAIFLPALILMIFTGFLEELIFRGVFQYFAIRYLGRWGIVYVGIVFAVLHIGYNSALDFVFVLFVSLLFSYIVHETGSILGVTLAHGFTNIGLFLIFPFLITLPSQADVASVPEQRVVIQEFVEDNWENEIDEINLSLEDDLITGDCYLAGVGFSEDTPLRLCFSNKPERILDPSPQFGVKGFLLFEPH